MRRTITTLAAGLFTVGLLAGPATAEHAHHMENGSGCVEIPVNAPGQDHGDDVVGKKFHGAAHVGAAVDYDGVTGYGTLGQGNSPNRVGGGPCPAED